MMNSWQFARIPMLLLWAATGAIAAVSGCRPSSRSRGRNGEAMDSKTCPHYWSKFFAARGEDTILVLAGRQENVPEYNDCQRLLVNTSGKPDPAYTTLQFDSVAAIWARAGINDIYQQEVPITSADTKRPFFPALRNPTLATTRVTAIAQVWTPGSYKPLGLSAEHSCIVLQWDGPVASSKPRNYHAWMVPVAHQDLCASPLDLPASSAFYLGARELPAQGNSDGPDEIPPVARWDWDPRRGEQYVGIACPSGWCELYGENANQPAAHTSSPSYQVPSGLHVPGHAGRVVRQKGWYDEEYLASTTPTSGKPPVLDGAGAFGTVFPVPELKGRSISDYPPGKFVPVGWISINTVSSGYRGKYGFSLNTAPPQRPDVNALSLCLDDGSNACKAKPRYTCSPQSNLPNGHLFYARLGSGPDDPHATDFCVDFIGTPGVSTPGTVRWRWLDDDQTIWVSCPAGCCQIQPPKTQ